MKKICDTIDFGISNNKRDCIVRIRGENMKDRNKERKEQIK